ncbi:MAG: hypothetical protein AABX29_05835 [Nanoarchaeota archaeon]
MFNIIFKRALITAIFIFIFDFLFHLFLTRPMETLTYFILKSLVAFFVATALFSLDSFSKKKKKNYLVVLFGLISSTLMSIYYRAWELGEAYVPFGSRAPDIIGIDRHNLLFFSGSWWLGHALFFILGALIAIRFIKK